MLGQAWRWQDDDVLLHALPIFHAHGLFVALHCALLGASPGASVSVNIVLQVIKKCFPQLLSTQEGQARMKAMIPTYDVDIKLPENAARFREINARDNELLQLNRPK